MRTVRLGSARAAAEELGLSPSALSRRIANLEDFTGKKLFTRARQAMALTDEGQAFHDAVFPHLEALAMAIENHSENMSLLRLHLGVLPLRSTFTHVIGDELDWHQFSMLMRGAGVAWDGALIVPVSDAGGGPVADERAREELRILEDRVNENRLVVNEGHFFDTWGRRMTVEEATVN